MNESVLCSQFVPVPIGDAEAGSVHHRDRQVVPVLGDPVKKCRQEVT
jgi:hypothetical protein